MSEIFAEDPFFDFKCPYCGEVNSFPATSAHTLQECASCAETIIVPEAGAETGGPLPLPISTRRLIVRRFHLEDAGPLLQLVALDESCSLPITETDVDQWIESQRTARFTRSESGVYLAIEFAESQDLAGFVLPVLHGRVSQQRRIYPDDRSRSPAPGIRIGSRPRGDGFPFRRPMCAPRCRLQPKPERCRARDARKGPDAPGRRIRQILARWPRMGQRVVVCDVERGARCTSPVLVGSQEKHY